MKIASLPRPKWWLILIVLVLQLVVNPCWHSQVDQWVDILLVALNCIVVLLLITYVNPGHPIKFGIGVALGVPIIVLYWITNTPAVLSSIYLLTLALYIYVILLALPSLLRADEPGIEQVAASLSLYILIGMAWAIVYYFIELLHNGAFAIDHGAEVMSGAEIANFVYFSFVTLTTLGYGDIVPLTCLARSFAILEAVCGLACLSFVVARLVGLSAASKARR